MGAARERGAASSCTPTENIRSSALLIEAAEDTENLPDVMPTLWSLRDVDRTSNLYLARS